MKWRAYIRVVAMAITALVVIGILVFEIFQGHRTGFDREVAPGQLYEGIDLQRNVIYATTRGKSHHSLRWISTTHSRVQLVESLDTEHTKLLTGRTIFVFIHGFHGVSGSVASYFREMIDFIRANTNNNVAFIVYDWPALGRDFETLDTREKLAFERRLEALLGRQSLELDQKARWEAINYIADQHRARNEGAAGLQVLIEQLTSRFIGQDIILVGHSMGCEVINATAQKYPVGPRLKKTIWLAPDVSTEDFVRANRGGMHHRLGTLVVYFSHHDAVLGRLATYMNFGIRLGQSGHQQNAQPHAGLIFFDMTPLLGNAPHDQYLRVGSGVPSHMLSRHKEEAGAPR